MVSVDVRIVVDDLDRFTEAVVKELTFEAHAEMTEACPVDTGWARANFVPEIGAPNEHLAGTRAEAERGVIDQGPANQGLAKVAGLYRLFMGAVFITWGVPYGPRLNDGWSKQAPAGFIQASIGRAVVKVASRMRQAR